MLVILQVSHALRQLYEARCRHVAVPLSGVCGGVPLCYLGFQAEETLFDSVRFVLQITYQRVNGSVSQFPLSPKLLAHSATGTPAAVIR